MEIYDSLKMSSYKYSNVYNAINASINVSYILNTVNLSDIFDLPVPESPTNIILKIQYI